MNQNNDLALLMDRYGNMVLRLAVANLGNMADAQDVCQEVFMKLHRARNPFHHAEHEKAWIIRVTMNTCRDVLRSPWRRWFSPVAEVPIPYDQAVSVDVVALVLSLPRKYRTVIHLYYYEGYKTYEKAPLLDMKEATIRTQLKRARELLKAKLEGGMEENVVEI